MRYAIRAASGIDIGSNTDAPLRNRKNGVIDHLHMTAKEDIERAKEEESESIAYMKKKEKGYLRLICALSIALAVTLLIIVTGLVLDMLDPSKGFFWLRAWFGGKSGLIA